MLNQSESGSKTKHAFFSFNHPALTHIYLIEKVWDGKKFIYKLRHSYASEFTLSQWEGLAPWPDSKSDNQCPQIFQSYRGKILTKNEIEIFLDDIIVECETVKNKRISDLKAKEMNGENLAFTVEYLAEFTSYSYLEFHSIDTSKLNQLDQQKLQLIIFRKIYKALLESQSGWIKSNFLAKNINKNDRELLIEINSYVKNNPNSRTAAAWDLTKKYSHDYDANSTELFQEIYQYSFKQRILSRSQLFGTFWRKNTIEDKFSEKKDIGEIIKKHEKNNPYSRTAIICRNLRAKL